VRFNRQFPIGRYICDFVSRGAKHSVSYDAARTRFLEQEGYRVLRFWNNDVMENLEGVVNRIARELADSPSPNPSRTREGGLWGPTLRWPGKP
jgi:very-short-patch-repair endonuclease